MRKNKNVNERVGISKTTNHIQAIPSLFSHSRCVSFLSDPQHVRADVKAQPVMACVFQGLPTQSASAANVQNIMRFSFLQHRDMSAKPCSTVHRCAQTLAFTGSASSSIALLAISAWICTIREDAWYFLASCALRLTNQNDTHNNTNAFSVRKPRNAKPTAGSCSAPSHRRTAPAAAATPVDSLCCCSCCEGLVWPSKSIFFGDFGDRCSVTRSQLRTRQQPQVMLLTRFFGCYFCYLIELLRTINAFIVG